MAEQDNLLATAIGGLVPRSIGPAFMGGRIADIAIHPTRRSTWYLGVGSGGVWKTTNAGTTWTPLFDDQSSYSIGCVTIDPNQPDVIWVGTGEAVSGRHVAWGDGVYRSRDGGASWQNMGLALSEHISEILVDPRDSNTVFVAAEGPLWSPGGQRGVYKTTDGGTTWEQCLRIDSDTGVTSIVFAPDDPDVIYAAAYQRRRRVWSFLGGGARSGIHKSTDGGQTWRRLTRGLPEGDMGKIGLAVSPADPTVVFATIEAGAEERGLYRSTDRGESWERRNEYVSGGTGGHYYQEIFASPSDPDLVIQVDVFLHVTRDGGKTVTRLETGKQKHSDNHVVWIDPDNDDHLLVGTDAGLYETFDQGESFRHFPNLPISQFYRVAVDNREPFPCLLGGAQDLGTLYGPTRTGGVEGVRNQDWTVTLGADGYHVAFDHDDPNICYMEEQVGNVFRMDRRTMELQDIKPMPAAADAPERWNWDCPIVVSRHDSSRIYVASQRVWRSEDRGESWTAISADLTRNLNRYELAVSARTESVDALWDHMAMSQYSTITHLSESPIDDDIVYVGTDDGLVQMSEDGGNTWHVCGELPEFPDDGFINNVKACEHSADHVFVVADAHKNGDYTPYVFASTDRGRTWQSIGANLPDGTIVWALAQDHRQADLLFLGTEFGVYVTIDGGDEWHKLSGIPTISVRDLAIQRRDDDLIVATFGRGFYVLDDYQPLRRFAAALSQEAAALFPVRDAWWYIPHQSAQAPGQPTLGSTAFSAPNPDVGALFTYWLPEDITSQKEVRVEAEKAAAEDDTDIGFPGWDVLWSEHLDHGPRVFLVVRDSAGTAVRRLEASRVGGLHRASWDLRLEPGAPPELEPPEFREPWHVEPRGPLVAPGTYSVELVRAETGTTEILTDPQSFVVKPVPALVDQPDVGETTSFSRRVWETHRRVLRASKDLDRLRQLAKQRRIEISTAAASTEADFVSIDELSARVEILDRQLRGDPTRARLSEADVPSIRAAIERVAELHWNTTQPPTRTQRDVFDRHAQRVDAMIDELNAIESGLRS